MRKTILLLALLAVCSSALAGGYTVKRFVVSNVATSATETTASVEAVTGKPLAFSWKGDTNITVRLFTTAGVGMSPSAQTIVAATNVLNYYLPLPEAGAQYFYADKVTLGASLSLNTNATAGGVGLLLIELP